MEKILLKQKLRNDFKDIISIATKSNFYADINYFSKQETKITLDDKSCDISKDSDKGIKMRVWDGNKFIEFASSSYNFEFLKKNMNILIESANKNSNSNKYQKLSIDKEIIEKDFGNITREKLNIDNNIDDGNNNDRSNIFKLEDKTKILNEIKDKILKIDQDIVSARVLLLEKIEENIFINEYKNLSQIIPLNIFVMIAFVKCEDGNLRTAYESFVDSNFISAKNKGINKFNDFKENIQNMKKAQKLEGGKYKVLLAPKLSGLLAHESFGHGLEADTMIRGRAMASDLIGSKIGNNKINIIDYPLIKGKYGEFYFDNEGNLAKKTYLVKEGIINEPMSDLYSKTELKLKSSSNSRFESYDHKNYVRMSNTYFENNENGLSYNELISKIDDGIYISSSSGGMEDPKNWGVQIQGNFGQRIKNGKLIDEFYDGFTLTGFLPDIINNISEISKEFLIEGGGHCGKGHKEWVRVSEGGPFLLIDEIILG